MKRLILIAVLVALSSSNAACIKKVGNATYECLVDLKLMIPVCKQIG